MSTLGTNDWNIPEEALVHQDALLACLLILANHFNSPCSAGVLTERLPLVNDKLTPELFIRAAARAKLAAEINKIAFSDISPLVLPTVLLLKKGDACLLIEKNEKESTVLLHKTGEGEVKIANDKLEAQYSGYAIFVKPVYQYTRRAKETMKNSARDWFWPIITTSWPMYTEALIASFLINLFALAMPLFTMNVYDRVVPNQATQTLWVLVSGVGLIFLFDLLLKTLRSHYVDSASKKTDVKLSALIFEQILGMQMAVRPTSVGAFANVIQSFEVFREFIASTTITVLIDLPFVLIYLLTIYFISGSLVIVPLAALPVVFFVGLLIQRPLINMTKVSYQLAQEKHATLIESLSGIEAIKSSGAEGAMQYRFEQAVINAAILNAKLHALVNTSVNISNVTQQLANVLIVVFGVYKIIDGNLTVGGLIACTILSGRALAPMGQVAAIFTRYYQSMQALDSINTIMNLPTDVQGESSYLHRPHLDGTIEFKDVSFTYPNQNVPVLQNVSFTIKQGERVGIIGRIGSGKSTIAKFIMGLYKPDKGSIYMDGTDYLQINPAVLRKHIGYVPQDVILFYGSIKDNIQLGTHHIHDEKMLDAATISGVTSFTNTHPEGFDRQVGERGSLLSAGQRQAVAIARALMTSPNILIMDEPTSSMDDALERQLRNNIKEYLSKDMTFILVTHKTSMLELVDRLIVLDKGRVVANGPKETVLTALRGGAQAQKEGQKAQ